jgi:drug/metabolite transporter (DMT)-like permease
MTQPAQAHDPRQALTGIALMLVALVLLPGMDAVAKHLSQRLPILEIIWARYFFHIMVLAPVLLWRHRPGALIAAPVGPQLCRGLLLLVSTTCFVISLSLLPLADASALFFTSPLIIAAAAPYLLGERVGWLRWGAVGTGFAGALVIVHPGFSDFHWGSLFAIAAAFINSSYILLTRRLAGSVPPLVALVYVAATGAVLLSLVVPFVWIRPDAADAGLLVLVGLLAATGHFCIIRALERAPASVLAPCSYFGLVTASALGVLIFGQWPDLLTWTGMALVVGTGIAVSLGEHWRAGRGRLERVRPA